MKVKDLHKVLAKVDPELEVWREEFPKEVAE